METIKEVLIRRDGMTFEEADDMLKEAREEFDRLIEDGEIPYDFCEEWFGLELDYLVEFMDWDI